MEELKADLGKSVTANQERDKELEKTQQSLKGLESTAVRMRILLLARLSEYQRELEFWRDLVRQWVLESGGRPKQAEEAFARIARTLGTHQTLAKADFDLAVVLAGLLRAGESESSPIGLGTRDEH
jgi:hypothetical protein